MSTAAPVETIRRVVLDALAQTNLTRPAGQQLAVGPDAAIFGPGSPLDSLGLVAFLIDLEELLQAAGVEVTFADAHTMSESRSPFRDVPSLVDYIARQLQRM